MPFSFLKDTCFNFRLIGLLFYLRPIKFSFAYGWSSCSYMNTYNRFHCDICHLITVRLEVWDVRVYQLTTQLAGSICSCSHGKPCCYHLLAVSLAGAFFKFCHSKVSKSGIPCCRHDMSCRISISKSRYNDISCTGTCLLLRPSKITVAQLPVAYNQVSPSLYVAAYKFLTVPLPAVLTQTQDLRTQRLSASIGSHSSRPHLIANHAWGDYEPTGDMCRNIR